MLAGRIAATVGAPKLGRKHHLNAYRHDPKDWEARYYYARMVLRFRGALDTLKFLKHYDADQTLGAMDPQISSNWLALHATVLGQLRDFDGAEQWLAKAEKIGPTNAWLLVERANLFEMQDRYEDALGVLRYALMTQPHFRPAISLAAHLLVLLGRDEEAIRLLDNALQRIECAWLAEQLANLQIELGQFPAARQTLERFAALSPMLEPEVLQGLNSQRSDAAYLSGDHPAAIEFARQCDSPYLQEFAKKMQPPGQAGKRVLLPVGFVRQHHMTCAPATLSSLSRYYRMPTDHLNIAEEICYDGTPAHSERKWAVKNGYAVREFRATWEDATQLLSRGIAFTLTTVDPGNAHLQAVIGYDSLRGSLIVRDPFVRHYGEWEAKATFARYQAHGPRGMALVPASHTNVLNSLPLTDAQHYDHLFALQEALENHDRTKATAIYQSMTQRFGEHRITLQAKISLAAYSGNHAQVLSCFEKLLELYPADVNFKLHKISCLRALARRGERLDYLKQVCTGKNSDPLLWQEYARELSEDARLLPQAMRWVKKVVRSAPLNAQNLHLQAGLYWQQQKREEALELYRFAACLNDKEERYANSYFIAARHLNRTETAIAFLQDRFQRFGDKSWLPVRTLFQALEQTGQRNQAFTALSEGLTMRPDDGALKLYAAESYARYGKFEQAVALLSEAQNQASHNEWLRTAALIATYRGQLGEALLHWLQVADAEALALDANSNVAQLLAETEGHQAALDFLRDRTMLYPHNADLRQLLIEWLLNDPAAAEKELRRLIEIDPANDWAQRSLAFVLSEQQKPAEAFAAAVIACQLDPGNPDNFYACGKIQAVAGKIAEAQVAYHQAIKLSADHAQSLAGLMTTAATPTERREALRFIRQELLTQTIFGDGLMTFRDLAKDIFPAEELLPQLRELLRLRPDLPQAWSVVIAQLTEMQQLNEALQLGQQVTENFPLSPRAWLDLALVHEAKLAFHDQINALQNALAINPGWALAIQKLADAYERTGRLSLAKAVIEQAITHAPLNAFNHGYLADLLWKNADREKALNVIQHALSLDPNYDWGWRVLRDWSEEMKRPELAVTCARDLTTKRPGDPRAWITLARTLKGHDVLAEQLAALERAIALHPRAIEAHSLRSFLLADAERYDEALKACRPAAFAGELPPELKAAEAYIEAQRGDVKTAINKLRRIVHEEPNYAPGWERLARLYRSSEQNLDYLKAAQELTRLMPQYSVAWGYLGESRLRNNNREGAKEAFHRAISLAPDYDFAGFALFDLHLEDHNVRGATDVLERLQPHVSGDSFNLRALRLAAQRNDHAKSHEYFFALCNSPDLHFAYLNQAVEALTAARLTKVIDIAIEGALDKATVNPYVGSLWVQRCADQQKFSHCLARLELMAQQGDSKAWHCAAGTFLEACTQNKATQQALQFIQRYNSMLRAETESWGVVGTTLYSLGNLQETVSWMSDWQERPGVAPWMLWNFVLALRALNREFEAQQISMYAINLPEDNATSSHLALLSLDEALAGRIDNVNQHAQKIVPAAMSEWDQVVFALAEELRDFHTARNDGRKTGAAVIEQMLRIAEQAKMKKKSQILFGLFKRAIENVITTENDFMLSMKTKLKLSWLERKLGS